MKIESVQIKNFKAITEENLVINGNNVYVMGGNAKGKTSFIDSIFKVLSGDLPPQPLTDGESKGNVKIDLGEFIVEYTYNKKGSRSLTISTPDGAQYSKPRTMLDKLVGVVDFSIDDFFRLRAKEKVEKIKKLIGIDWSDVDEEFDKLYKRRTFLNGKLADLEALPTDHDRDATAEIPIMQVQAEIQAANEFNADRASFVQAFIDREHRITAIDAEFEAIKEKLIQLRNEKKVIREELKAGREWLDENPEKDITEESKKLQAAIDHNKRFARAEEVRKNKINIKSVEVELENVQAKMDEIDQLKRDEIAKAKLPVPGMSFDDNQLYLDGLPFELSQINTAKIIIAVLQLNLAMMEEREGKIRIARFDGSLLDNSNVAAIEAWAKENDLQLFVEFVERDGSGLKIEVKE